MRVTDHVNHDLPQSRTVGSHQRKVRLEVNFKVNAVLFKLTPEKRDGRFDRVSEVYLFEFVCFGTSESQESSYDFGDASTFVNDAVNHLLLKLRTRLIFVFEQLGEVDDTVKRIIDLMCHAGRKLANGCQLRRLVQLPLHFFALGFELLTY